MEIRTDRLYIRNLHETDWRQMKNIFVDFKKSEYSVYDRPLPTEDSKVKELTKHFADSALFFAVFQLDKDDMLSYVCFHRDNDKYDLGYCFHSSYHSNGYAFESISALIRYFNQIYKATRFTAGTAINNIPSCSLLQKLGLLSITGCVFLFILRWFFGYTEMQMKNVPDVNWQ